MGSLKVTFTLRGLSAESFKKACEISGLKACDFAKSASVSEMRKWMKLGDFQNAQVSSTGDFAITCAGDTTDNLLSEDNKDEVSSSIHNFFKAFVANLNEIKFPERIHRTIKEHWKRITESGLSASEMAESYNEYIADSKRTNDKYKQANSWIVDGGWQNETKEVSDEPVGNYDY
jgi:hypothetical protein